MANEPMDRVVPMNQLPGYRVADGEPDIRGWDVVTRDGRTLGRVDDLLVDTQANKVRYVDVQGGPDGHVRVPIETAQLRADARQVLVDGFGDAGMQTGGGAGMQTGGAAGVRRETAEREGEVRMTLSEEQLAVGTRQVQAGEVGVHKTVETRHVHEDVEVRREVVDVERRPITDPMAAGRMEVTETEDEIRIPLHAEQVVVEKRVIPAEELVVRKREVVETQPIEAEVRRERAEVDREVTRGPAPGDGLHDGRLDGR